MNEYAILHRPEAPWGFPVSDNTVVLRLRIDKNDAPERIDILHNNKYDFTQSRFSTEMTRLYEDRLFAWYEAELELCDRRLAYVFELTTADGTRWYSEDGLTETYDFSVAYYHFFQMAYVNSADIHREISWCRDAVFYQVFPDRFFMGDREKDTSYINLKWGEIPSPKSFAGGDLAGVTEKLPYIRSLGANALYLTPVFASISNHKYDISDYYTVSRDFGTNADLKTLVDTAHKAGMRVMLDAVFNHCSDKLMQFQDVVEKGRASRYHGWFMIDGDKPCADPRNYEVFGACAYMPKLDTSNPEVQEFLLEIALHYIREYDIDGWRLDVSDEVSHEFWRLLRRAVKREKPDCLILGENWHDSAPYLAGDQFDGVMNYAVTKACLDYFVNKTFTAEDMAHQLNHLLMRTTHQAARMNMNLLDCHDTHRFLTQAGGDVGALQGALALIFCLPGMPSIYYGTEVLMEGGYDPDCRRCMEWDEGEWDMAHMEFIRGLAGVKAFPEVQNGAVRLAAEGGVLTLTRTDGARSTTLYLNQSGKACSLEVKGEVLLSRLYDGSLMHNGYVLVRE